MVRDYKLSFAPRFEDLRFVFKISGRIRDCQLMIAASKERLPQKQYYSFRRTCNTEINHAYSELTSYLANYSVKNIKREVIIVFRAIDLLRPEYVIFKIKDYVASNENLIQQEFNSETCDYHKIRRWVKEQYYLLVLLEEVFNDKIEEQLKIFKKETGSILGNWHDLNVLQSPSLRVRE